MSRDSSGLIAILLINWGEFGDEVAVRVVGADDDGREVVDLEGLQLVARQARDSMNIRFFNIFRTNRILVRCPKGAKVSKYSKKVAKLQDLEGLREGLKWIAHSEARTRNVKPDPEAARRRRPGQPEGHAQKMRCRVMAEGKGYGVR